MICVGVAGGSFSVLLLVLWIWSIFLGGSLSARVCTMTAVSGLSVVMWSVGIVNGIKIIKRANQCEKNWKNSLKSS